MANRQILIIDDEKNILESVKMVLTYEDYEVDTAINALDGLDKLKVSEPDLILLDVKMPGMDGLDLLETIKEIRPFTEVIMISGHSGIEEAVRASQLGAFDFLEKPLSRDKLLLTVRNALEKTDLLKENYSLKSHAKDKYTIVGDSRPVKELRDTIKKVARTNSTVLITGESGTGKELIARQIHELSSRSKKDFVQVNCAAIPDELIESELFGHVKGSFTGAIEDKTGKFESAHNGTIFLDEIADLSLKAQAKVLRVLEEGEVQKVGTAVIKTVNVRVIAATNKDLTQEIEEGKFREDLFFRLNVIPLYSPTLRERRGDIPLLIEHFVSYFSQESNFRQKNFSPEVVELFNKLEWQGNIREFRNIIERLLIMSAKNTITMKDIPDYMKPDVKEPSTDFSSFTKWKEFKAFSEKSFIESKLAQYNYNISLTAREIELPRSNLYKKIENLGIILSDNQGDK